MQHALRFGIMNKSVGVGEPPGFITSLRVRFRSREIGGRHINKNTVFTNNFSWFGVFILSMEIDLSSI